MLHDAFLLTPTKAPVVLALQQCLADLPSTASTDSLVKQFDHIHSVIVRLQCDPKHYYCKTDAITILAQHLQGFSSDALTRIHRYLSTQKTALWSYQSTQFDYAQLVYLAEQLLTALQITLLTSPTLPHYRRAQFPIRLIGLNALLPELQITYAKLMHLDIPDNLSDLNSDYETDSERSRSTSDAASSDSGLGLSLDFQLRDFIKTCQQRVLMVARGLKLRWHEQHYAIVCKALMRDMANLNVTHCHEAYQHWQRHDVQQLLSLLQDIATQSQMYVQAILIHLPSVPDLPQEQHAIFIANAARGVLSQLLAVRNAVLETYANHIKQQTLRSKMTVWQSQFSVTQSQASPFSMLCYCLQTNFSQALFFHAAQAWLDSDDIYALADSLRDSVYRDLAQLYLSLATHFPDKGLQAYTRAQQDCLLTVDKILLSAILRNEARTEQLVSVNDMPAREKGICDYFLLSYIHKYARHLAIPLTQPSNAFSQQQLLLLLHSLVDYQFNLALFFTTLTHFVDGIAKQIQRIWHESNIPHFIQHATQLLQQLSLEQLQQFDERLNENSSIHFAMAYYVYVCDNPELFTQPLQVALPKPEAASFNFSHTHDPRWNTMDIDRDRNYACIIQTAQLINAHISLLRISIMRAHADKIIAS
tara:strand:+ start:63883 stop:65820 length:1938 start_codon:yes stop_codon:yes gene_type:complete